MTYVICNLCSIYSFFIVSFLFLLYKCIVICCLIKCGMHCFLKTTCVCTRVSLLVI
ncbi:hypothetical protein Hanom_Chr12g01172041 [Helianthus anomalus]